MMKHIRHTLTVIAALGLVAWAAPAFATLDLTVEVDKTKNVDVVVDVDITKTLNLTVTLVEVYEGHAQALALANVENIGNEVNKCSDSCPNQDPPTTPPDPTGEERDPFGVRLSSEIVDSINNNQGIVGVNQDSGNMVNQGNIVSLSRSEGTAADPVLLQSDAQAEIQQKNKWNKVTAVEHIDPADVFDNGELAENFDALFENAHSKAVIRGSATDPDPANQAVSGNNGVVGVNQNAGNNNNQTNALAMTVGFGNALVLTEAALGQENIGNVVDAHETVKLDVIENSVNSNNGVIQVNQTVGSNNNQGSAIAFGALTTTATIGVPGT